MSLLKSLLAAALVASSLASSAIAGSSENWLEARLAGERLVLAPKKATLTGASYVAAPGVGIYNNMLYRTTPLLSAGGAQIAGTGPTLSSGAAASFAVAGVASCAGVAAGQQVIDASTGTLLGTVSATTTCTGGSPITIYMTANNLAAITSGDSIVIQNTLPDTCQGTFAGRARGNIDYSTIPVSGFLVVNAFGTGGGFAETSNGLWLANDPNYRFNWHNPSNQSNTTSAPYLNTSNAFYQNQWFNLISTWSSCTSSIYAVLYVQPVGGSWTRLSYNFNTGTSFNANTSSPAQGTNHAAFSFHSDGTSPQAVMGDFEDLILDLGTAGGAVGFPAGSPSCGAYNDGNPCIPTAVLNAYGGPTGQPVRINSTGNCSDLFAAGVASGATTSHQPVACFSTDSGGAYSPSAANFLVNRGSGGTFLTGAIAQTSGTPGPASFPASGPVGPYAYWTVVPGSGSTGSTTFAPLATAVIGSYHAIVTGDFLVVAAAQASVSTLACSTGWTTIYTGSDMGNNEVPLITTALCYRVATGDANDGLAVVSTTDTTTPIDTVITNYRGVDVTSSGANAIDALTVFRGTYPQTTQPMPNVLTSYANDLYVGVVVNAGNNYFSISPATGTGARGVQNLAGTTKAKIAVLDMIVPTTGVTSIPAANTYYSSQQITIGFALKPAGATFAPQAHLTAFSPAGTGVSGDYSGMFHVPLSQSITTAACWGSGAAGAGASGTNGSGGSGGGYASVSGVSAPASGIVYWRQAGYQQGISGVATQQTASSFINLAGSNGIPASSSQGCNATSALASTSTVSGTPGCGSGNTCIGTTTYTGGAGGNGGTSHAGGGGAGSTANGTGGSGTTGGAGGVAGGGAGGNFVSNAGTSGIQAGGGGGGSTSGNWGAWGASGQTQITY